MDKYKNKPKTILISAISVIEFEYELNAMLLTLYEDGADIHDIKPWGMDDKKYALIIYS